MFKSGFAVIIGRPNVGKSTLLNRVLGRKIAIMSDKPQTTRNKIQGVYTTDTVQIVFLDTPGLHKPKSKLGDYMVRTAVGALEGVDLVLWLVDATDPDDPGEKYVLDLLRDVHTPIFLVINKIDKIKKEECLPLIDRYRRLHEFAEIVPISALEGTNVDRLLELMTSYLPEGPLYYPPGQVTDHPESFVCAELIREKVLHLTREEVPHSIAVVVEEMKTSENGVVTVRATIYTERESQKGILIGKGGAMLKEIGRLARLEMEQLFGSKMFLDLWVKVKKDWRNSEAALRSFGYRPEAR